MLLILEVRDILFYFFFVRAHGVLVFIHILYFYDDKYIALYVNYLKFHAANQVSWYMYKKKAMALTKRYSKLAFPNITIYST